MCGVSVSTSSRTCPPALPKTLCGILGYTAFNPTELGSGPLKHIVLSPEGAPVTVEEDPIGRVQAYTLGYERDLPFMASWLSAGLGLQATVYNVPPQLRTIYGNRPATVALFLKFRPIGNMTQRMKLMHQRP